MRNNNLYFPQVMHLPNVQLPRENLTLNRSSIISQVLLFSCLVTHLSKILYLTNINHKKILASCF